MGETFTATLPLTDDAQEMLLCVDALLAETLLPSGTYHWLLALLECRGRLVETLAPALGDPWEAQQRLRQALARGEAGEPLPADTVLALAASRAEAQGTGVIRERELACAILHHAGYAPLSEGDTVLDDAADTIFLSLVEEEDVTPFCSPDTPASPLLDKLGYDLTCAARDGALSPVIGRQEEIQLVIETLCRRTKRNPALIGAAGVGKTAVVEGLAQRIAAGAVPAALRDLRIVSLSVTSLVANCRLVGEFEERMTALLAEAKQPHIVLFIDEAHTMMGAGAAGRNGNDLANIIKPALARGEIACIAATTNEEYRLFIEADAALERRFQPIRVQQLTAPQTLQVLGILRDQLAHQRGVEVPSSLLAWIVDFAGQYLHNRFFPDKAVDILEQCVAYGLTQGKTALDDSDVATIARRMVGMPQEVGKRLAQLRAALTRCCLLPAATIDALLHRLEVTLRGLDVNAARPNAVLLLLGEAATQADLLCETISDCLYGSADRVVSLDFSRFLTHADVTMLVGSPPGYVGFEGRVSLHQVMQMPWCVLACAHLQTSHAAAREILTQGLRTGTITLADGKRVFLCDAIVVLTADIPAHARKPLGFDAEGTPDAADLRARAAELLGAELMSQVDITCADLCRNDDIQRNWLEDSLLAGLSERFRPQGIHLSYDHSLFPWLLARSAAHFTQTDWERLIDEHLCPVIISHLPDAHPREHLLLRLTVVDDACRAERCTGTEH